MPGKRRLNVSCTCLCTYSSSIMVPDNLSEEEAIAYARDHIKEINVGELNYIADSDELDEENSGFDTEDDDD